MQIIWCFSLFQCVSLLTFGYAVFEKGFNPLWIGVHLILSLWYIIVTNMLFKMN